jgi:hypothetical protein
MIDISFMNFIFGVDYRLVIVLFVEFFISGFLVSSQI